MHTNVSDSIDISPVITALREQRVTLAVTTLVFFFASVVIAYSMTKWFRAETVIVAVDAKSLPGGLSQLSGLASLAGVNLSRGDSLQPLAVLRSKSLIREYVKSNNLLPILFADKWDAKNRAWVVSAEDQPSLDDGVALFDERIRDVIDDRKAGTITLRITWTDPQASARWANDLVVLANNRLRNQALREAERNVAYLKTEIGQTAVVSLQDSLGQVLESEMQKLLLAKGNSEFAFKVVDAAVTPRKHHRPIIPLLLGLGISLGIIFGVLFSYLRHRRANVVEV
jgi:uncharacterized protein involved in exopolysaccharide biosynthesis